MILLCCYYINIELIQSNHALIIIVIIIFTCCMRDSSQYRRMSSGTRQPGSWIFNLLFALPSTMFGKLIAHDLRWINYGEN